MVRELSQIEIDFSEDVQGVDVADILVNGQPAVGLVTLPGGKYLFQFNPPAPGTVILEWAANHGIFDLAATPHPFGGGAWTIQVDPNAVYGNMVINEIMADNLNGILDEDSETSDWLSCSIAGATP